MTKYERNIIKISLIFSCIVFLSFNSTASAQNMPIDQNDSIYKYNALENKVNFLNNTDDLNKESPEDVVFVDDNIKKLEDITKQQTSSIEKSEDAMTTINNTSALRTFIIGNRLGILKFQLVQMEDQSNVLKMLALETTDNTTKENINAQIEILRKEQEKVKNFILEQDNKFILFGWLIAAL